MFADDVVPIAPYATRTGPDGRFATSWDLAMPGGGVNVYVRDCSDAFPGFGRTALSMNVLADKNYDQVPFLNVLQLLHRHKGVERTMQRAQTFTDKARSVLSGFPEITRSIALATCS